MELSDIRALLDSLTAYEQATKLGNHFWHVTGYEFCINFSVLYVNNVKADLEQIGRFLQEKMDAVNTLTMTQLLRPWVNVETGECSGRPGLDVNRRVDSNWAWVGDLTRPQVKEWLNDEDNRRTSRPIRYHSYRPQTL